MSFNYQRTIHFSDTDAAGVVFFANYLAICHEAYEEALANAGIGIREFFSNRGAVVPVSKSNAEFIRPLYCGDKLRVSVGPVLLTPDSYAVEYEMVKLGSSEKLVCHARTSHVCIDSATRERIALPPELAAWIAAG